MTHPAPEYLLQDQQINKLNSIIRAVLKQYPLGHHPKHKFWPDKKGTRSGHEPKMFMVGMADMFGIHKGHTVSMLCIEDVELYSLREKFSRLLCQPVCKNSSAWKNGDYARYIVKYRKIANLVGLNAVSPMPYTKAKLFSPIPPVYENFASV